LIKKEEMHYVAISRKQSYDPCLWDQSQEKTVLLKDGKTELSLKKRISSAQGGVVPKTHQPPVHQGSADNLVEYGLSSYAETLAWNLQQP
jgi:hypothetical protein|tara:strand:- start:362 stop:631 length:270 start_codon:yes stop_codon:yes gene_type:complete